MTPNLPLQPKFPVILSALVALSAPGLLQAQDAPPDTEEATPRPPPTYTAPEPMVIIDAPLDPTRVAGSANVVGEAELKTYQYNDIQRVLKQVPGVYLRDEDGFGLRPNIGMRGASPDRSAKLTLMEDGILIGPAPYAAPAAYYFPLTARLAGVEVYKGPASIQFGPNTVGGAINLLSRGIPEGRQGAVDVAMGQYGSNKAHVWMGDSGDTWGVVLEGMHLGSSGFKTLPNGADTGFNRNDIMAKVRLNSPSGSENYHRLELKLGYGDERSNETYLGLSDSDFQEDPYQRYAASSLGEMSWWRTLAELTYTAQLPLGGALEATLYRHDFSRAWRKMNRFQGGPALNDILSNPYGQNAVYLSVLQGNSDTSSEDDTLMIGVNDRQFVSQGLETRAFLPIGDARFLQTIEGGLRLHSDFIERDHYEDGYAMTSGTLVPTGQETLQTSLNRGEAQAIAAYARDELRMGTLLMSPGLRVEGIRTRFVDNLAGEETEALRGVVLPGFGILWQPSSRLGLLGGIHRGFSPVAPGQPAEIGPEISLNYEGGVRLKGDVAELEAVAFFNNYQNLTATCTFSSGCLDEQLGDQYSGGQVYVYGAEATAGAAFEVTPNAILSLHGAYTLTQSAFQSTFPSQNPQWGTVREGDALPYVPIHQGALRAGWEARRYALNAALAASSAMRDTPGQGPIPEGQGTDPYALLDLSGRLFLGEGLTGYATLENALGTEYVASRRPFGARPGKPRWFMIGVEQVF